MNGAFPRHRQGIVSRQAQARWPAGTYEEHHGRDGFAGDCSQLWHRNPTTNWTRIEGSIRPRGMWSDSLPAEDLHDPRALPHALLSNPDVRLAVSKRRQAPPYYYRNADGDLVYLIQRGSGLLQSDYGELRYGPLEYLVIPKGTNHRLVPDGDDNLAYIVETRAQVRIPDRGLLGHYLPFDIGVLDVPELPDRDRAGPAGEEWEIVVKRGGQLSSIFYDFDPLDAVGWQGTVAPQRLRLADIRPLSAERLDVAPMTHATFLADGLWICTFCPRPWQTSPDAAPVQPFHRNVDCDEVFITVGVEEQGHARPPGLMSVTPGGMDHGPGAALVEHPIERFPFYLLNIDTVLPLEYEPAFDRYEIENFEHRQRYSGPLVPIADPTAAPQTRA